MKTTLSKYLDLTLFLLLGGVLILLPFLPSPILILSVIVLISLIIKSGQWVLNRSLSITLSPFDTSFSILLGVIFISSLFSSAKTVSFLGTKPLFEGSFVSWLIFILFYFIFTSSIKNLKFLKLLSLGLFISSLVISFLILNNAFSFFPLPIAYSLLPTAFLFPYHFLILTLMPLIFYFFVNPSKNIPEYIPLVLFTTLGFSVTISGDYFTLLGFLFTSFILFSLSIKHYNNYLIKQLLGGVILVILLTVFLPKANWVKIKAPVDTNRVSILESINVFSKSLLNHPFFGTGLNTFPFIYNLYRENPDNNNARFAYNQVLETGVSLGFAGLVAFGYLIYKILASSLNSLIKSKDHLNSSISACLIIGLVNLLFFPLTPVSFLTFLGILGIYSSINHTRNGFLQSRSKSFILGVFIYFIIISVFGSIIIFRLTEADYYYSLGGYYQLKKAYDINPLSDLYSANLSLASFAQAQAIADFKKPTNTLSPTDEALIKGFLLDSFKFATNAVAQNPLSSKNWLTLGLINQKISKGDSKFKQGADYAFQMAILNNPKSIDLKLQIEEATGGGTLKMEVRESLPPATKTTGRKLIINGVGN